MTDNEIKTLRLWNKLDENDFEQKSIEELELILIEIRMLKKTLTEDQLIKDCMLMEFFVIAEQNYRATGSFTKVS